MFELVVKFKEIARVVRHGNFLSFVLGRLSVLRENSGARRDVGGVDLVDHEGGTKCIVIDDLL